jgi:hypothetical protein
MAAPLVSVTVPRIVPRKVCADADVTLNAVIANAKQTKNARMPRPRSFLMARSSKF